MVNGLAAISTGIHLPTDRCYAGVMAFSCEPWRTSAYSEDMRWRMVWQRLVLGYTYQQIGANLGVDTSTTQRTVSLFELTGSVQKRPYPKDRVQKKVTPTVELIILTLVIQQPGTFLREVQAELRSYCVDVDISTICFSFARVD